MKVLWIAFLSNAVFAQTLAFTPEQVAAECTRQMSAGICLTRPDRSTVTPGQTMLLAGVGRVAYSAYIDFAELYDPKVPGNDAMCQLALKYMKSAPEGDHAKLARALWAPSNLDSNTVSMAKLAASAYAWSAIYFALALALGVIAAISARYFFASRRAKRKR